MCFGRWNGGMKPCHSLSGTSSQSLGALIEVWVAENLRVNRSWVDSVIKKMWNEGKRKHEVDELIRKRKLGVRVVNAGESWFEWGAGRTTRLLGNRPDSASQNQLSTGVYWEACRGGERSRRRGGHWVTDWCGCWSELIKKEKLEKVGNKRISEQSKRRGVL